MSNITVVSHPLIQHKLTMLRDKNTSSKDFRELVREIAMLMAYEVTRNLPVKDIEVETPIAKTTGKALSGEDIAIVPVLRAGLGMVDGMLDLIPNAKIGHIGLYRNEETLQPVEYYCKLPSDIGNRIVIITEPMLSTGGSMIGALTLLKQYGAKKIKSIHLVCAPEGLKKVTEAHPDVEIYTAAIDEKFNDIGYIVPGLGDAGDRLFGTK
ncbi:uracil phosphoribosyltransferase [Sedimentibacter hydroxybenzoicus DSM 7310]|uniref:Uracil phosphoribosyltransferase n=1 Tax=Sedimentibacter hydroxybenzoicus DSM 7310 TaxID=1123245 RepID=A0A974BJ36_SEDHY|nr:uracil phosphoribosyltransferase [Sedimentibacter hydroxybenzoicus]NYB74190.1 uracil phosphoribosyltransferase [Sedimentibacter hydroxybenzoicus DSM 7310]